MSHIKMAHQKHIFSNLICQIKTKRKRHGVKNVIQDKNIVKQWTKKKLE